MYYLTLDNLFRATTAPWQSSRLMNWFASMKKQRYILIILFRVYTVSGICDSVGRLIITGSNYLILQKGTEAIILGCGYHKYCKAQRFVKINDS